MTLKAENNHRTFARDPPGWTLASMCRACLSLPAQAIQSSRQPQTPDSPLPNPPLTSIQPPLSHIVNYPTTPSKVGLYR